MPVMFVSSVFAAVSPNEQTRVLAFLIYTVSLFLIGLFMGLGRYRGPERPRKRWYPREEPTAAELLKKRGRPGTDSSSTAA